MNEIILISLIAIAGYYLLIHQQEKPITNSTNSDNQDLEKVVDTLIHNIRQLNQSIK